MAIFLVMAMAAAIIASSAYTKTTIQSDTSGEIQAIQIGQKVNYTIALANIVSTELHHILNESSIAKDVLNQILISNFSSLFKMLDGLQMNLTSHAEQFDDVEMETDGLNDTISSLRIEVDNLDLKLQSLRKVVSNLQQ